MDIKGHIVKVVWIERASDIAEEYYASFTLDRAAKMHLGMLSAQGGVEIEQVAEENPDAIAKIHIDPVDGLTEARCREWVAAAKLNPDATEGAVDILLKLYRAYTEGDADLVEINPLILTPDGRVHALDAKVTLDDNAIFRHPDYADYDATQVRDEREEFAHEQGLQYVGLDGSVGVIANGAGLAMSTVDIVNQVGGSPANFLDIGGGANADVMAGALDVIVNDPNVRSIFINIFGGITKGEEVANGIVQALERVQIDVADRDPPRRHQRRRGSQDPRTPSVRHAADAADHARRREQAVELAGGERPREHLRRRDHQGRLPGPDRWPGPLLRPAQPRLRHAGRRRHQPEEGRHRRRRHPRLRQRRRRGRRHRRAPRRASSSPRRA